MAVSERSTKATLLKEVERLQGQLATARQANLNPTQVKKAKRKQEVKQKTEGLSLDNVEKSIGTLRNRVQTALQDIETSLNEKVQELATVDESLKYKQEEVQEIFGIEQQAETLAALIQAQQERKEVFEKDLQEKRDTFNEEQARLKKQWLEEKAEYERVKALEAERDQAQRQRELEEASYNFSRQEKEKLDALTDQLNLQRKQFQAQIEQENKALAERAEEVAKREAVADDLQAKVVQLETKLKTDVEAAVEATKKGAAQSKAIAESAIRKDYEAQVTVLNGKLESTTAQLESALARVGSLDRDLAAARAQVNAVALRALDASSGQAALAAVQGARDSESSRALNKR